MSELTSKEKLGGTTHGVGCWTWHRGHYECALAEIERLQKSGSVTDQPSREISAPVASGSLPNTLADSRAEFEPTVDWKARAEEAEGILSHNMALANATTRRAQSERNGIIRKMRERYSAMEIADMVGLTRQRVHQILNEAPVEAESSQPPAVTPDEEGSIQESTRKEQAGLLNAVETVWFRAGLLACRAYMAAFVQQGGDKNIADSILANWWPSLGDDPGQPRKNTWQELTVGEYGEPGFRTKTREEVSPSIEALPVAQVFLQAHCGWPQVHYSGEPDVL